MPQAAAARFAVWLGDRGGAAGRRQANRGPGARGGDAAFLELTDRFDATEQAPASLRVDDDAQAKALVSSTRRCASRLSSRSRMSARSPTAQVDDEADPWLAATGSDRRTPRGPRRRRWDLRPGRPGGLSVERADVRRAGTGRRRRSPCSRVAARARRRESPPLVLAAAALCEIDEIYAMGGAQAIFALAYGTESIEPWTSSPARETPGFGGQADVYGTVGIDSLRRPLRVDARRRARHRPASGRRLISVRKRSTEKTGRCSPSRSSRPCSTRSPTATAAPRGRTTRRRSERRWRSSPVPTCSDAIELANAFAPEHLELLEQDAALLAERCDDRRLRLHRAGTAPPPSATTSPAPTMCCRPAAPVAFPGRSAPASSAARSPPCRSRPRPRRSLPRTWTAIARAEGFPVHGESAMIRVEDDRS